MDGHKSSLTNFLANANAHFAVPCYQRKYCWDKTNCAQFYNDLRDIATTPDNRRGEHLFGSIIHKNINAWGAGFETFLIIDGQQRITTVMLFFSAIYNLIQQGTIHADNQYLSGTIRQYLFSENAEEENRNRLKLNDIDGDAYTMLMIEGDLRNFRTNSNIKKNYEYFCNTLIENEQSENKISVDDLYNAMNYFQIINITLEGNDNPQRIFESINTTGVRLSAGDEVRNYVLMDLESPDQENYYQNYWRAIEIYAATNNHNRANDSLSDFIKEYLSIKTESDIKGEKLYDEFKKYALDAYRMGRDNGTIETYEQFTRNLLGDMRSYARIYSCLYTHIFTWGNGNFNRRINDSLNRFDVLDYTIVHPFLMEVLRLLETERINENETLQVFTITESYLFRRCVMRGHQAHRDTFVTLNRDIARLAGENDDYVSRFKYVLLQKRTGDSFINDNDFACSLREKDVYKYENNDGLKLNYVQYMFERFENFGCDGEIHDIYNYYGTELGNYSIEHIMPKVNNNPINLSDEWKQALGDNYEEIHKTWRHRLGNLTITAYNPRLGESTFDEKKTMDEYGYIHSALRINRYFDNIRIWNKRKIKERNNYLVNRALEIWAYPTTEFRPNMIEYDAYHLTDEDVNPTNRDIVSFDFRNRRGRITTWSALLREIVGQLYNDDSGPIENILTQNIDDDTLPGTLTADDVNLLRRNFSAEEERFRTGESIGPNMFVNTNSNTYGKVKLLRLVLSLYGVDPNELIIYLKKEDNQ